jgi:hypothetical protein
LEGGPPRFSPRFTGADLLRNAHRQVLRFRLRDGCPLWCAVPRASSIADLCNCRQDTHILDRAPYNPRPATRARLHRPGLGWIPFRSPLLGESRLISFPRGTEMFQFPRLPPACLCIQQGVTPYYQRWVSPFGNPRINGYSAPTRGLSQPFTPFIDSWCQGIHHVPFLS